MITFMCLFIVYLMMLTAWAVVVVVVGGKPGVCSLPSWIFGRT
jgi:hypothetical protein